jgi:hypothetical protein
MLCWYRFFGDLHPVILSFPWACLVALLGIDIYGLRIGRLDRIARDVVLAGWSKSVHEPHGFKRNTVDADDKLAGPRANGGILYVESIGPAGWAGDVTR